MINIPFLIYIILRFFSLCMYKFIFSYFYFWYSFFLTELHITKILLSTLSVLLQIFEWFASLLLPDSHSNATFRKALPDQLPATPTAMTFIHPNTHLMYYLILLNY